MSDANVHTQSSNEDKIVKIMGDLVSSSLRVPCLPGTVNVVALLGVPLNTLGDIDNLTKAIDLGKLKVWSDLPSEKHTEVMETIWAMWDAFLTKNPNVTSGYSSDSGKSDVVDEFFDVSLTTLKEIDDFTKDLELGKYAVWSEMTCDTHKEVLDNISTRWNAIGAESKSKSTLSADDNMYSEVSPNVPIVQSVDIHEKPSSYVGAAGGPKIEPSKPKANFCSLCSKNLCDGAKFSIPRKVVETVSTRLDNTLYGYFICKRIAFPVVDYYARNNWGKYGLIRIMMNSKGFFFFKFKTSKGLDDVLENGPWMIRNIHIILKKWSIDTRLCKDDLTRISVWVKIHDVPIQVFFFKDGLSIIASQIGKPIMLDSYTTLMCIESWGRSSFARCLIEINMEDVLQETLTMGVPLIEGTGFTIETHSDYVKDHCPKKVSITPFVVTSNVATPSVEKTNDGFQTVGIKKKKNGKSKSTNGGQFGGHPVKQTVRYEPKATTNAPKKGTTNSALDEESEEEVKNVYDESANLLQSRKTGGSSSTFTVAAG
ncbi:zinc knuckle CX2CX4HX4C containing protein [Tanacetum coccineum]